MSNLFVCLLYVNCIFVCLFICSFVCLYVCSFVICLFICLFVYLLFTFMGLSNHSTSCLNMAQNANPLIRLVRRSLLMLNESTDTKLAAPVSSPSNANIPIRNPTLSNGSSPSIPDSCDPFSENETIYR